MIPLVIREGSVRDAELLVGVYHSAYRENRKLEIPLKLKPLLKQGSGELITEFRVYLAVV